MLRSLTNGFGYKKTTGKSGKRSVRPAGRPRRAGRIFPRPALEQLETRTLLTGLTINATFDPTLDASAVATIRTAINAYQNIICDSVTVAITSNQMIPAVRPTTCNYPTASYDPY